MADLLECRVRKFARMSAHYRELADGFWPLTSAPKLKNSPRNTREKPPVSNGNVWGREIAHVSLAVDVGAIA